MQTNRERHVVIRYEPGHMRPWPWSITHEDGQPVLTITDMDDSSMGIALRAIAQAGLATADGERVPVPHEARLTA